MTQEEWKAMYPNGVPDKKENNPVDPPDSQGVEGVSPASENNDNAPSENIPSESPPESELDVDKESQDVDDRGVPWKNVAKEYERKFAELEARTQVVPEELPPVESFPELPPSLQQQQSEIQQQPELQGSQQPELPTDWEGVPAYLQQMEKTIGQKAEQRAEQKALRVVNQQQTEQKILSDYPDMKNPQSPLFQWTQYELNTRYGNDPRFVEEATMRAAARCNVQAKSTQSGQTTLTEPQPKALPRTPAQPPNTERGISQRKQGNSVKLSDESVKAAKMFGQNLDDLKSMVKKQRYTSSTGAALFQGEN